jgi:hypothetical protein
MSSGGRPPETATFAQALASLKRRGSNLLLVGPAYEETHLPTSRRLLGSGDAERSRLLVLTDGADDDRRLGDLDPATVRTITYDCPTRGAAATTPATDGPFDLDDTVDFESADLADLSRRICSTVDEIAAERGGLDAAELRLCFDSLVPLAEAFGERELFRFLHVLTAETREAGAMAHYHLPVAPDDPIVRTLSPLFEAVVELRTGAEGPQQRWRLTDEDVVTEWLPV